MDGTVLFGQKISLGQLDLLRLELPQKSQFRSGIGERRSRDVLIIKWTDLDGNTGYGECACRPDPFYSEEFTDGAIAVIQKFIAPYLKPRQTYKDVLNLMNRIRGWNFTKAAVEAAMFQIIRLQSDIDLSKSLHLPQVEKVPAGISLGIYDDKIALYDEVQKAIEAGYQRLKFKISSNSDLKGFEYINPLLFDHNVYTGFDANGSFSQTDFAKLDYFVNTYKTVIEQPFAPSRFDIYLEAKKQFPGLKICADEEVKSIGDLMKLKKLNAIDQLNLKPGRVGGVANTIEIINYCHKNEVPCWIGGMFETGIGRLLNLEFASYLPNARAHDLSPSGRYFEEDIISPEVIMNNGFIDVRSLQNCKIMPDVMDKYTIEKIKLPNARFPN